MYMLVWFVGATPMLMLLATLKKRRRTTCTCQALTIHLKGKIQSHFLCVSNLFILFIFVNHFIAMPTITSRKNPSYDESDDHGSDWSTSRRRDYR